MSKVIYAAYGSNINKKRFLKRIPKAKYLGVTSISGYSLVFNKLSIDGSSKLNISKVDNNLNVVYLALYEIEERNLKYLNLIETGYSKEKIFIKNRIRKDSFVYDFEDTVYIYIQKDKSKQTSLNPYSWYYSHIVTGIIDNNDIPITYLSNFKNIEVQGDLNLSRLINSSLLYTNKKINNFTKILLCLEKFYIKLFKGNY